MWLVYVCTKPRDWLVGRASGISNIDGWLDGGLAVSNIVFFNTATTTSKNACTRIDEWIDKLPESEFSSWGGGGGVGK